MPDYRCENCGHPYSLKQYNLLPLRGEHPYCIHCRHSFGKPWTVKSYARIDPEAGVNSPRACLTTKYSAMNLGADDDEKFYVSWIGGGVKCHKRWLYSSKEEAMQGHRKLRNSLKERAFTLKHNPLGKKILEIDENPQVTKANLVLREIHRGFG